jgi:murein DD-endopeptidase MepM/ murein hydrolase activator NlpD
VLAGLDPIDDETRKLGVGGPLVGAPTEMQMADPAVSGSLQTQDQRLDLLGRRVHFQQQSLDQTLQTLRGLGDRLAHTPAICPLRGQYVVSADYGWRNDPFTGERAFHTGLDLRAEIGTPVFATADGEVAFAGYDGEFGHCIRIRHGYGYESSYCHLGSARVTQGQKVTRGTMIGSVGTSGRSTGPHLHYEVAVNGSTRDPAGFIMTPRTTVE